jgi:hypothetical protein
MTNLQFANTSLLSYYPIIFLLSFEKVCIISFFPLKKCFLIQKKREIIPIEVKAEENLKAKSLKVFVEKFESKIAFRVSMSPHRKESWLENIPLYAAGTLNSEFEIRKY